MFVVLGLLVIFAIVFASAKAEGASSVTLHSIPYQGLTDGEGQSLPELKFKVYLPNSYEDNQETRFPVIYLLHGANGGFGDSEWESFFPVLDRLTADGSIPPMIAVAPVAGNSYWVDSHLFGPYETAVVQGLIGHMDANYRTLPHREHRFLAGFSMGGYGALRYGLAYPELFEAAILLSPFVQQQEPPATSRAVLGGAFAGPDGTFGLKLWDRKNYPALLASYAKQQYKVRFFIYATDDDWNHMNEREDLPADAWRYNMEVQAVLLYSALKCQNPFNISFSKGEDTPGNPAELRIVNGGHEISVWLGGFHEGLLYLFDSSDGH